MRGGNIGCKLLCGFSQARKSIPVILLETIGTPPSMPAGCACSFPMDSKVERSCHPAALSGLLRVLVIPVMLVCMDHDNRWQMATQCCVLETRLHGPPVQVILTGEPVLVSPAASLLETILQHNIAALATNTFLRHKSSNFFHASTTVISSSCSLSSLFFFLRIMLKTTSPGSTTVGKGLRSPSK